MCVNSRCKIYFQSWRVYGHASNLSVYIGVSAIVLTMQISLSQHISARQNLINPWRFSCLFCNKVIMDPISEGQVKLSQPSGYCEHLGISGSTLVISLLDMCMTVCYHFCIFLISAHLQPPPNHQKGLSLLYPPQIILVTGLGSAGLSLTKILEKVRVRRRMNAPHPHHHSTKNCDLKNTVFVLDSQTHQHYE